MSLVLDTGALIAYERGSRTMQAFLELAYRRNHDVRTTTAVVAQGWHGDPRQVLLARLLRGVDERELSGEQARRVRRLLRQAGMADVVDGTVVDVADDGDEVLTSDPDDIRRLTTAAAKRVIVTRVS